MEEVHDLYSLVNIILVIKSRRMSWVGQVVCMGESVYRVWWENLREQDHLEELGIYGNKLLNG
jgi:prolipoprotein diacylglyceryltransferase